MGGFDSVQKISSPPLNFRFLIDRLSKKFNFERTMTDTENPGDQNQSDENNADELGSTSENDHLEDVDLSDATLKSVEDAESADDVKKQLEAALL